MSKNLICNEEEVRDIIQCYLDSEKKIDLCQLNYIYRYPGRKRPSLPTIKKVVQIYTKSNASTSQDQNNGEVSCINAIKDYGILKYLLENTHASIKKAASIFHAQSSYIEQLLEEKNLQIELENEANEMSEMKKTDSLDKCKKDLAMMNNETIESEDSTIIKDNLNDSLEVKTEIDIVENDPSDFIQQERNKVTAEEKLHCEDINTNKRKPDIINSEINKKLKSHQQQQKTDTFKSDIPFVDNVFVYTTRLEDMAIWKVRMNRFGRSYIIKKILSESQPKFDYTSNTLIPKVRKRKRKRKSLNWLQKKMKWLSKGNKIHPVIDLTEDDSHQSITEDDSHKSITEDDSHQSITEDDSHKSKVIIHAGYPGYGVFKHNVEHNVNPPNNYKCNLVIMINSKNSQLWDIYVIDSNGNVVEYHSTKSDVLNEYDPSKVRLKLYTCCWYQRRREIDKTWPLCDTKFARFLIATHKCPPDRCTCCCKPRCTTSENSVLNNVCLNPRRVLGDIQFYGEKDKKNLIHKALMYERKSIRNDDSLYVMKKDSPPQHFIFSEDTYRNDQPVIKTEFYEIGTKQDIIYQAVVFNKGLRVGLDVRRMLKNFFSIDTNKLNYSLRNCCKFKRDSFLIKNYSAGNISQSVLRYLKNTKIPFICDNCKEKRDTVIKDSNDLSPVLNVPSIEHTGTLTDLNIDLDDKSYEEDNFTDQTLPDGPYIAKSPKAIQETPREEEMDQLELNCKELPGFVFTVNNVQHQLAIAFLQKFTTLDFTISKVQGKIGAFLNLPEQSISKPSKSADEFQIFSGILMNLQNRLQDVDLPSGTKLSLEVKIKTDETVFKNCRNNEDNHPTYVNILQNVHEDTESLQKVVNTDKSSKKNTNTNNTRRNNKTKNLREIRKSGYQSINETILNKYILCPPRKNTLLDNTCDQNIAEIINAHDVSKNSRDNISSEELEITEKFKQHYTRVDIYKKFKILLIRNKMCHANTFSSYLRAQEQKRKDTERIPVIVNVFSLNTEDSKPNDHSPSTSNVPAINIIAKRNDPLLPPSIDMEDVITDMLNRHLQ